MKKALFTAMLALSSLIMVGCASNNAESADTNPVTVWQQERMFADVIQEKNNTGKPVTLSDVQYKSEIGIPAIASAVEIIASFPSESYHKVVTEVDQLNAFSNGRKIYYMSENAKKAIAETSDPAKKKEIQATFDKRMAELTPEEKKALEDYKNMISQMEQEVIIESTLLPMLAKLAEESAKLAAQIALIKDSPEMKALAGFTLISESKNLASDAANIGTLFSDTIEGANLWKQLLEDDRRFRDYDPYK